MKLIFNFGSNFHCIQYNRNLSNSFGEVIRLSGIIQKLKTDLI